MISIYSDGASGAKGGKPGGWAFVIVRDGEQVLGCSYGGDPVTTNNVMELTGAIEGLKAATKMRATGLIYNDEVVELVSDSQYVLGLAGGSWNPTKNLELAKQVTELTSALEARTRWVRGHTGEVWNTRADSLAGKGKDECSPFPLEIVGAKWVRLTKGRFALIDESDLDLVQESSWHLTSTGYAACRKNNKILFMHRMLLQAPDDIQVDHIDRDRLNNRRSNLRLATNQENAQNKSKAPEASSKYKGVHYRPESKIWRAYIDIDGHRTYLGNFSNEEVAAKAYDQEAIKRFGSFANTNFKA